MKGESYVFQYFKERLQEFVTLRNGGKVEKSH